MVEEKFEFFFNSDFQFHVEHIIRIWPEGVDRCVDTMTDIAPFVNAMQVIKVQIFIWFFVAHYLSATFGYNQLKFDGVLFRPIVTGLRVSAVWTIDELV